MYPNNCAIIPSDKQDLVSLALVLPLKTIVFGAQVLLSEAVEASPNVENAETKPHR
jgi:hypothetical protein